MGRVLVSPYSKNTIKTNLVKITTLKNRSCPERLATIIVAVRPFHTSKIVVSKLLMLLSSFLLPLAQC